MPEKQEKREHILEQTEDLRGEVEEFEKKRERDIMKQEFWSDMDYALRLYREIDRLEAIAERLAGRT